MITHTLALMATVATIAAAPLAAQTAAPLGIFPDLVGEWEGDAWIVMGPDGRHEVHQRETVRTAAGGTVIVVEGLGVERLADGTEKVVHDAYAIVHLDHDGTTPLMRAFTAAGRWMDMDLKLLPNGYDWSMVDPRAGTIRYEMRFDTEGRWVEKGFMSRDGGTTWMPFFEMVLSRVE
jgi:hypothetical protein